MVNGITETSLAEREFMLGQCYLSTGNGSKALECFISASDGIGKQFDIVNAISKIYDG